MKRSGFFFVIMVLILSFCFALPLLSQEKKGEGDTYTIKRGDTLWDISERFLKDPFLWPKLWQRNPYITNPHWIYPGNPVRLNPLEEEKVVAEEKVKEPPKEPEVKKAEPPAVEKKPEVAAKPAEEGPPYFPEARTAGFFSDINYRGIGIILDNKDGKTLAAEGDIVYLAFKGAGLVQPGNKFTVFRPSELIDHPLTGLKIGRRYQITGILQVIDQNGSFYTAKIVEAFDAIYKGDMLQPYLKEKMEVGELRK
ncbi:MAG: LysM peptidoglycan-binding domain-containing protein [Deltaproteobacteria bacterium]|nr:MAG: LysM peptidoglycan-binding domain-containing protein [Deltaproteobacteria bacterium]